MAKSKLGLSRFLLEIFSIFLGVTIAFLANHLNEVRKDHITERKILQELNIELDSDLRDIKLNINGHKLALEALDLFEKYCRGEKVDITKLGQYFERLYRDYISITNTTAYETLKSRGIEIITNEELRFAIVNLYDFDYEIMEKLEEQYYPAQFHQNYFSVLTKHFKSFLEVQDGKVIFLKDYNNSLDQEIMLIFREIRSWRIFLIDSYTKTTENIGQLKNQIKEELDEAN